MGSCLSGRRCPNLGFHVACVVALLVFAAWPYSGLLFFVTFFNILAADMFVQSFLRTSTHTTTVGFFVLRFFIAILLLRFVIHVATWHLMVKDFEETVLSAQVKSSFEDTLRDMKLKLTFPDAERVSDISINRGYYAIEVLCVAIFYPQIKKWMFRVIQKSSLCRVQNITIVNPTHQQRFSIDKNSSRETEFDPAEFDSFHQLLRHLIDTFGYTPRDQASVSKHLIFDQVVLYDDTRKQQVNQLEELSVNHRYTLMLK